MLPHCNFDLHFPNNYPYLEFSVQSLSCVQLFETPWTAARQASSSIASSQNLLSIFSCVYLLLLLFKSWSHVPLFATPWKEACQASLSITNFWNLLELMSIELVMTSNHLILCHPPLLLPSIFLSIRVFSNESAVHIRWPKYWSFSFCINPSSEYSGLISFRVGRLDLLAVQGTLKSLLQHHNSKASILRFSAVFLIQFSHLYMTTAKIMALTIWTFVDVSSS